MAVEVLIHAGFVCFFVSSSMMMLVTVHTQLFWLG